MGHELLHHMGQMQGGLLGSGHSWIAEDSTSALAAPLEVLAYAYGCVAPLESIAIIVRSSFEEATHQDSLNRYPLSYLNAYR